jgi:O-antigen/teichoic acid export membrane protein
MIAGSTAALTVAGTLATGDWITRELLGGSWALLWCFEGSVLAYAVTFIARGVLSGLGDFKDFGRLVAAESAIRLILGAVFALLGARSATAFGVAILLAPLLSTAIVTRAGGRIRLLVGPAVRWTDLTSALSWLVLGSLLAQFLANAGPLAVQLLASETQQGQAGRFLSALVIARLVLYLFQAVQATLLPNIADLLAAGRTAELHGALRRLTIVCAALIVVTTAGALALGPLAVRVLFGADFVVSHQTMTLLAGASGIYVLASALSAAAIAASGHRLSSLSWLTGCLAFVAGVAVVDDLFLRVELGYLLGSSATALVLLVSLPRHLRRHQLQAGGVVNVAGSSATL